MRRSFNFNTFHEEYAWEKNMSKQQVINHQMGRMPTSIHHHLPCDPLASNVLPKWPPPKRFHQSANHNNHQFHVPVPGAEGRKMEYVEYEEEYSKIECEVQQPIPRHNNNNFMMSGKHMAFKAC